MESSQIVTIHIQSVDQNKAIKSIKHTITELDRSNICLLYTSRDGNTGRTPPMADNRKYYYLKLKESYFDDDAIVLLESMPDGILSVSYTHLDVYKRQRVGRSPPTS